MKKTIVTLILVTSFLLMAVSTVFASDAVFDLWKGVFGPGRDITLNGHNYSDAEGFVILNYRKGQSDYVVNVVASGLQPGSEYIVRFLYNEGSSTARELVGYFTADEYGNGHLNFRGFKPSETDFDDYATPPRILVYYGEYRVLTTALGEVLEPVDSNRGE